MSTSSNTSTRLLTVVIGLQALTLAIQFLGQPPQVVAPAAAQMPDAGAQRNVIIDELRGLRSDVKAMASSSAATGARLDKMAALLDSGNLQVRVVSSDQNKRPAAGAAR